MCFGEETGLDFRHGGVGVGQDHTRPSYNIRPCLIEDTKRLRATEHVTHLFDSLLLEVGKLKAPPVCMMYVIIPGTEYQVASLVNAIRLEDDVILLETVPCPHVNHVK